MRDERPTNSILDVAGLAVGSVHDEAVRTGVTVIVPDARAVCAVAVAGGGPGTRETDALAPDTLVDAVDAVVLSGGSVFGLAAADGVVAALAARGRGFGLIDLPGVPKSPVVPAAILYDLSNGGAKDWGETPPYRDLGRRALVEARGAADGPPALGRAGAGFGARAGSLRGGLGSASADLHGDAVVGAIVAVNSFGSVTIPGCDAFWAWPLERDGEAGGRRPPPDLPPVEADRWGHAKIDPAAMLGRANTTIACVATDVALTPAQARRVATMALAGLARAIRPVFAPFDGDVVFCLSTARRPLEEPAPLMLARLGAAAADVLARAVMRGVHLASAETPALRP